MLHIAEIAALSEKITSDAAAFFVCHAWRVDHES